MSNKSRLGKYELVKRLAAGGMAEVYLATAKKPRGVTRTCIIKKILPELSNKDEFTKALIDEARIGVSLSHPNLVTTLDFAEQDNTLFICLEYVDGPDLGTLCDALAKDGVRFPIIAACRIMSDVLAGLDYAHNAKGDNQIPLGIIHRDVNPPNILISNTGDVKLADFGIAHAASRITRTRFGQLKGKIPYMSPEQASGERLDHRSDLFSCGVMMFEILTGGRLFAGMDEMVVLKQVREGKVFPPSAFRPKIDTALDKICLKALEKERDNRYSCAAEFKSRLDEYIAGLNSGDGRAELIAILKKHAAHWERRGERKRKTSVLDVKTGAEQTDSDSDEYPIGRPEKRRRLMISKTVFAGLAIILFLVLLTIFGVDRILKRTLSSPAKWKYDDAFLEISGGNGLYFIADDTLLGRAPLRTEVLLNNRTLKIAGMQRCFTPLGNNTAFSPGGTRLIKANKKIRMTSGAIVFKGKNPVGLEIDGRAIKGEGRVDLPCGVHFVQWNGAGGIEHRIIRLLPGQVLPMDLPSYPNE